MFSNTKTSNLKKITVPQWKEIAQYIVAASKSQQVEESSLLMVLRNATNLKNDILEKMILAVLPFLKEVLLFNCPGVTKLPYNKLKEVMVDVRGCENVDLSSIQSHGRN
jgi:hypothetical protein